MNRRSSTATKGLPVGVRFEEPVLAALKKLADQDERSVSFVINKIVKDYLRAKKLIK